MIGEVELGPVYCQWPDCDRIVDHALGLCKRCHQRALRAGRLDEFTAPPRVCQYCGDFFFTSSRGGNKMCSEVCAQAIRMARQQTLRLQSLTTRYCGHCGTVVPWHMVATAEYCSVTCQQAAWYKRNDEMLKQRAIEWNAANAEQKKAIGQLYYKNNRERAAMMSAAWRAANPEKAREISRNVSARRRARLRGVEVEDFSLGEIWERDEGICWLCEVAIDPLVRWPDPGSVSLEHKVPISRGGGHTRDNCALAHLGCNIIKGNKLISEAQEFQLLLVEAQEEKLASAELGLNRDTDMPAMPLPERERLVQLV